MPGAIAALAGLPLVAGAVVNTSVVWQVSTDYQNWSSSVVAPTGLVYVRCLVSYTGTASPAGLASFVFQPTVSNWDASDVLSPFLNGGMGGGPGADPDDPT